MKKNQKIVRHLLTLFAIVVFGLFAAGSGGSSSSSSRSSSSSSSSSTTKDISSQISVIKASDGLMITNSGSTIHNARIHINSDYICKAGNISSGVSTYKYTQFTDALGRSFAESGKPISRVSILSDDGRGAW